MDGDPGASAFPHLFTPLRLGPVQVRNRIVSSGHDTVMAVDGKVTDRLLAYHEARAAGGVGLIVVQVAGVHPSARYTSSILMADDDSCLDGLTRLAGVVQGHGATIVQQLFHDGRELMESGDGTLPVALAPSAVPNERFHVMPRAMPLPLVREIVASYGDAAARVRAAGYDGVEVVASHGYLPAQFLNPRTNLRDDDFGGTPEARLRFLREVLGQARRGIGADGCVGLRVSMGELSPDGLTGDEVLDALRTLDAAGLVDYVSVVAGTSETLAGSDHIVPPMGTPAAYLAPLGRRVKQAVTVPVMIAGRIVAPQEAEAVIAAGDTDATVMTRALICDPLLPAKAAAGDVEGIRACIGCNQACIGHFHAGYPISCVQRPETGRELEYGVVRPATARRRVVVVGGGPGGMKAAVVAAQRGHDVALLESGRRLGGQVLLAQELPGREEFGGAATNLVTEISRAGVDVRLGVAGTPELLRDLEPDAVVVATGARPRVPDLELADEPVVVTAWDVVRGATLPGGRAVVADWRCDWIGLGVATLLARRGHRVTLAVTGYHAGQRIQQYVRDTMTAQAVRLGVSIVPLVRLLGADAETVYLQHVLTDEVVEVEAGALVLAQGHLPVDGLVTQLEDAPYDVHLVGDVLAPRTIEEAVLEGLRVGSAL